MKRISRCPKCGGNPRIKVSYDTLQIVCESCGFAGNKYYGDYYDGDVWKYGNKDLE